MDSKIDEQFEQMAGLVLRLCPPDTEPRRKIIQSNLNNYDKCLMLLAEGEEFQ